MSGPTVLQTRARVTCTVEVDIKDVFGPECTIGILHKVASDAARQAVSDAIHDMGSSMRIVGTPRVEILTSEVIA